MKHPDNSYWEYPTGMIVCGTCFDLAINETLKGNFKGDEAVTLDMGKQVDPKEAYQCDNCLRQSDNYDEIVGEDE